MLGDVSDRVVTAVAVAVLRFCLSWFAIFAWTRGVSVCVYYAMEKGVKGEVRLFRFGEPGQPPPHGTVGARR